MKHSPERPRPSFFVAIPTARIASVGLRPDPTPEYIGRILVASTTRAVALLEARDALRHQTG